MIIFVNIVRKLMYLKKVHIFLYEVNSFKSKMNSESINSMAEASNDEYSNII